MSHPESEHGLRVQLATALRERDEARTDAANLRFANDKARATTEKLWLERDELRAVAVNANKQTADVNALRLKQDEELVALRAQVQAWKDGVCQDCVEKDEAIAAARRECVGATEWLRVVRDAFGREHCDYCDVKFVEQDGVNEDCGPLHYAIGGVVRYLDHLAAAPIRAALAVPAAAPDTSPATLEAWEKRLEREAEVNDPNESEP